MISDDPHERLKRAVEIAAAVNYVGIKEAAAMLGLHYQTVIKYCDKGYLKTLTVGYRRKITLDEIDRYKREGNHSGEGGEQSPPSSTTDPSDAEAIYPVHNPVPGDP